MGAWKQKETAEKRKKLKKQLASDIGQLILDITGIIDPPHPVFSGGTNALRVLARGRWLDALDGTVNIASYISDESKAAKMPGYSKSIRRARELALDHGHWAARLHDVFFPLRTLLDKALALGADEIPVVTRRHLKQMRYEIDYYVTPHAVHVQRARARKMAESGVSGSGPSTRGGIPRKAKTESETAEDALEEPNQDNNSGEDNIAAEPKVEPNNHGEAPWDHTNWDDTGLVEKLLVSTGYSVSKVSEVLGSLASWSSDTEQRFDEIGADPNTPEPLRLAVATLKLPARIGTGIVSGTAGLADLVLNPDSRAQLYDGLAQLYEKPEILDKAMADFADQPKHEIASDVLMIAAELAMGGKVVSTLRKRGKKTAAPKAEDGVPDKTSIRTPRDRAVSEAYAEAKSRGVEIRGGKEADEWLDYAARQQGIHPESMHATTLGDDLIYIRDAHANNPRVIREELVHTSQQSRIQVGSGVDSRPALEIEAREELIKNRYKWGITNNEAREAINEIRIIRDTGDY